MMRLGVKFPASAWLGVTISSLPLENGDTQRTGRLMAAEHHHVTRRDHFYVDLTERAQKLKKRNRIYLWQHFTNVPIWMPPDFHIWLFRSWKGKINRERTKKKKATESDKMRCVAMPVCICHFNWSCTCTGWQIAWPFASTPFSIFNIFKPRKTCLHNQVSISQVTV